LVPARKPGPRRLLDLSGSTAQLSDLYLGWLASTELGDEWFPARCKMYLKQRPKGRLVTVDPAFPTVWRREPYYSQLLAWAQRMQIKIRIGLRCIELNADGAEQEVTGTRAWIEGREEARS
jgi:hypothetical protein